MKNREVFIRYFVGYQLIEGVCIIIVEVDIVIIHF